MATDFFKRIADIINGKPKDKSEEKAGSSTGNGIDKTTELSTEIISELKTNYLGKQISFDDETLVIWVQNSLFYKSLEKSGFKTDLSVSISNECGVSFRDIVLKELKPGVAPDNLPEVFPDVFLEISTDGSQIGKTARISSVSGHGSTIAKRYFLKAEDGIIYNIGIGKSPITADNSPRVNHIAIDDNPESPQFDKNKYVSRAHAHISYSRKYGFLLHVEHGGTRIAGKRTHIYRGNDKIELGNVRVPEPLKNGDIIVLTKEVQLLFTI